ncbi:MAG: hypothetical protein LBT40_18475 [Deltaproteobacteria bacterium]|nr:hypothetical protein [Deltaproteobacteria bacterium]
MDFAVPVTQEPGTATAMELEKKPELEVVVEVLIQRAIIRDRFRNSLSCSTVRSARDTDMRTFNMLTKLALQDVCLPFLDSLEFMLEQFQPPFSPRTAASERLPLPRPPANLCNIKNINVKSGNWRGPPPKRSTRTRPAQAIPTSRNRETISVSQASWPVPPGRNRGLGAIIDFF